MLAISPGPCFHNCQMIVIPTSQGWFSRYNETTHVKWSFSIFNMHVNHRDLRILLAYRFEFSRFGWGLRLCIYNKFPGEAQAAGAWITLWVMRTKRD